jgi:uncharacterized protein (DUF1501 family)
LGFAARRPSAPPGRIRRTLGRFATRFLSSYTAANDFKRQPMGFESSDRNDYPNTQLGSRLKLVSQLLKSGSRARVFYTTQSGYDTHSSQLYTHSRLLREFSDALKSFLDDLKEAQLEDRVVMLAFSEFGRRVKETIPRAPTMEPQGQFSWQEFPSVAD